MNITADELRDLINSGILPYSAYSSIENWETIQDIYSVKSDKDDRYNMLLIKACDPNKKLFPSALQVFRLSLGQPVVNFPPTTAKLLYEKFIECVPETEVPVIYDPSSGWGGRILGAISVRRPIHYIGTDPNEDNWIDGNTSRYELLANWFTENLSGANTEIHSFFDVGNRYTWELFKDGSEDISNNPKFQKYKGSLDFIFTSPPYFNREMYGDSEAQSWKKYGSSYELWRDEFLKPTLETCYEYLKPGRYMAWNIANLKQGKLFLPLEEDSVSILKNLGMEYKGKYAMIMSSMIGNTAEKNDGMLNIIDFNGEKLKFEPIFIFYKPV